MMDVIQINLGGLASTPVTSVATSVSDIGDVNSTLTDRELMRAEFFKTYDVMTGVRIAATLGGFFGLMVLLVIYKSKCKSKSLSDEHLNAVAAAVVEEEDQEIAEAAAYFSVNPEHVRGARLSLGNMSAPAMVLTRSARLSSIGGYTSLEPPACYYYQRGKSLPGSALRFAQQESYCEEDELSSPPPLAVPDHAEEEVEPCFYHQYLTVPSAHSRRLSSITCSSADSSYLERKGSACELGLPPPPPFSFKNGDKCYINKSAMIQEPWDFYYPIDIQVIQPTPDISPCGSERTLYDDPIRIKPTVERSHGSIAESISSITMQRLAPLASITGYGGALSDFPDGEPRSLGSDSVFLDNDVDTEDEVEGFATDSDDDRDEQKYRRHSQLDRSDADYLPYSNHFLQVPFKAYPTSTPGGRWREQTGKRRLSVPGVRAQTKARRFSSTISCQEVLVNSDPCCSHSCDNTPLLVHVRPPLPLPNSTQNNQTPLPNMPSIICTDDDRANTACLPKINTASSSCEQLQIIVDGKGSDSPPAENNDSWSQETLF